MAWLRHTMGCVIITEKIDNITNTITYVDSTASSTSASFIAPKEKLHCFTTIRQDELNKRITTFFIVLVIVSKYLNLIDWALLLIAAFNILVLCSNRAPLLYSS